MKGMDIFLHSVRLVLANLDAAFRLSIVPYLMTVLAQTYAVFSARSLSGAETVAQTSLIYLILSIGSVIASLWVAVAWHRFVLLQEAPDSWLPPFRGNIMLGYFGWSLAIGLLVGLVAAAAGVPAGLLGGGVLAGIVGVGVASIVFFRLGVVLPAYAVGKPIALREAWAATRGQTGTILTLAFAAIVGNVVISLPTFFSGNPLSVISLVYGLVLGWFALIIGVSLLTSLYGHFIEGRPID